MMQDNNPVPGMGQPHVQFIRAADLPDFIANLLGGPQPDPETRVPDGMDEDGHTSDYDCPVCFQKYLDTVDRLFDPRFSDPEQAKGVAIVLLMWGAFREEALRLAQDGVSMTPNQNLTQWDAIMQHLMNREDLSEAGRIVDGELPDE